MSPSTEKVVYRSIIKPNSDSQVLFESLRRGVAPERIGILRQGEKFIIRGMHVPQAEFDFQIEVGNRAFAKTTQKDNVENIAWRDLRFVKCNFTNCKFFDIKLDNCVFEQCDLSAIGFWGSEVNDVQFENCKMRNAALGGANSTSGGSSNLFMNVGFTRCDLRGSAHSNESYNDCRFNNCQLKSVDFNGAIFERCIFSGPLDEVIFHAFSHDAVKHPNQLLDCDFTSAKLNSCMFMGINMDKIRLPQDSDLIYLPLGPENLRDWQKEIGVYESSFIDYLVKHSGTPSIESRKSLETIFSASQVDTLVRIAAAERY